MSEKLVELVARAMAENAGFCWENCTQSQWMSDARAAVAIWHAMIDEANSTEGTTK